MQWLSPQRTVSRQGLSYELSVADGLSSYGSEYFSPENEEPGGITQHLLQSSSQDIQIYLLHVCPGSSSFDVLVALFLQETIIRGSLVE